MILLLWAAVCFALLVVDWCCWAPNRLDADMASEQLLANLLAQEGGVMSTNWYYSTELRVLNTQLVMAPLFRLFTSWHTVRVVGSVVTDTLNRFFCVKHNFSVIIFSLLYGDQL